MRVTVPVGDRRLEGTSCGTLPNGKVLVAREDGWALQYDPEEVEPVNTTTTEGEE